MIIHDEALHLAGLALAHALWSASDLEGDDMVVPLAFVRQGEQIQLMRFEAATQAEAIARGHEAMQNASANGLPWAFARDAMIRNNGVPSDAIAVESWSPGSDEVITVIQRYVPFARTRRFTLEGELELSVGGRVLGGNSVAELIAVVRDGIQSHTAAADLFTAWRNGG